MADRLSKGISIVFHPIFIPFYTLVFLLNHDFMLALIIPVKTKLILSCIVFLTTIVIPFFSVWVFYRMKLVHSILLKTREERIYPLLIIAIFYYMTYYLLRSFPVTFLFSFYMLGSAFLVILALIISFRMKISLHMIGIGGVLGLLIGLSFSMSKDLSLLICPAILLCGIIGSARLNENSHKPSEIYAGFLAGVVVMSCLFLLV